MLAHPYVANSVDWSYLSERRTVTAIEQSCKLIMRDFIFDSNDHKTWKSVTKMIEGFLTTIWQEGDLQGATANDAFAVMCGERTTMTSEDVYNGIMNVTVKIAVIHPAEFIIITIQQEQAGD